ncbi:MAG: pyrroline-5-carboxylate reductase [Thermotogota bacterium]|nr:pyrroline-5-carboxylate reductase [Thermotogota bacterium]MDK2865598.1 pyrroline-5-carboxylate reductase [Thermotogota bacterium]HCZ05786.1 pyrroline-5-carboxylate reductase [Thermotogota bacterium]
MVGIIGVGNIGSIIVERLLETGKLDPDELVIYDRSLSKTLKFKDKGVKIASSSSEVCEEAQLVFLAVKPQDAAELFRQIRSCNFDAKTIISTMTGITIEKIQKATGCKRVVRIMPNVPSAVGKGVIGVAYSAALTEEEKILLKQLLDSLGKTVEVREKDLAAVTALSGSGPAFVFVIVEALIDAGLRMGLSYEVARELVLETLKGSAELLQLRGNHPGEFRHLVTSPAGTTIEGIFSLEREGLRGSLMKALWDTFEKARYFENYENENNADKD